MSNSNNENLKKFLNGEGVKHLWTKIEKQLGETNNRIEVIEDKFDGMNDKDIKTFVGDEITGVVGAVPPDGEKPRTVVKYIQDMTLGVLTDESLTELKTQVGTNTTNIGTNAQNIGTNAGNIKKLQDSYNEVEDKIETIEDGLENAATKVYVDTQLGNKADQVEFAQIQETIRNFFAEDAAVNDTIDTLKEIVAYLDSNPDTELVTDLAILSNRISTALNMGNITGTETEHTVPTYVAEKLAEALANYAESGDLEELGEEVEGLKQSLSNYVANNELDGIFAEKLEPYVEETTLNTTLADYVTLNVFNQTLNDYITTDGLEGYVLTTKEIDAIVGDTTGTTENT